MGNYAVPANVPISDTWQGHKNRTPPSAEPGTDYATAYGTDVAMAADGVVSVIDTSPGGGEGRRLSIDLADGRRVSYLHLSQVRATVGQRVKRGQKGLCLSGASGYGSDWYYGPHVHVSLWQRPGMAYADTIDFQKYVGPDNTPAPEPPPEREDTMAVGGFAYTRKSDNKTVRFIVDTTSGFWFEWSDSSIKNADVARVFDTDPNFAAINQGGRDAMYNAARWTRAGVQGD